MVSPGAGGPLGIDLRGRYERRIDEPDGRRSIVVSVGFTWY